ncbi:hypothetical protein A4X13_0g8878 [Tilletia indica]|uniref:Uncharacterized protein n=1 Tax=Tilletia indica TaxID=43049 RepID=A0A177SZ80_9BASI|nr:hypothetical protein A4X13_0g8878 [Tilletia indica]
MVSATAAFLRAFDDLHSLTIRMSQELADTQNRLREAVETAATHVCAPPPPPRPYGMLLDDLRVHAAAETALDSIPTPSSEAPRSTVDAHTPSSSPAMNRSDSPSPTAFPSHRSDPPPSSASDSFALTPGAPILHFPPHSPSSSEARAFSPSSATSVLTSVLESAPSSTFASPSVSGTTPRPDGTSVLTSELVAPAQVSLNDTLVTPSMPTPSLPSASAASPAAPRPTSTDVLAAQSAVASPPDAHARNAPPFTTVARPSTASSATMDSRKPLLLSKSVRTASVAVHRVGAALKVASREIRRVYHTRLVDRTMSELRTVLDQLRAPPFPDPATSCADGIPTAVSKRASSTTSNLLQVSAAPPMRLVVKPLTQSSTSIRPLHQAFSPSPPFSSSLHAPLPFNPSVANLVHHLIGCIASFFPSVPCFQPVPLSPNGFCSGLPPFPPSTTFRHHTPPRT